LPQKSVLVRASFVRSFFAFDIDMASSAPLLSGTIEADEEATSSLPRGNIGQNASTSSTRQPVVLVPDTAGNGVSNEEGGIVSLLLPLQALY